MEVRIIKGTKQIGGCITEITSKKSKIIVDFGEDLDGGEFELEGLNKGKSIYDAVFITHSHIDHIGLINTINNDIDVYVEEKSLLIYKLTCDFCNRQKINRSVRTFKFEEKIKVKGMTITPYLVDHSAYNSCMFLIEAEDKKILHTGDYRNHGRKGCLFRKTLEKVGSVDLLITEGTSLSRSSEKYKSEYVLENDLADIMKKYNQVFFLSSTTNIDRTISLIKASLKTNKKYIMTPFTYHLNEILNLNIIIDYKSIFVWKPILYKYKSREFKNNYLNIKTSSKFGKKYAMEVKTSMIEDIKLLKNKNLIDKACLIYSMWDGYKNEENTIEFLEFIKNNNIDIFSLHTSGHADIDAMKLLNKMVKPKKTLIIHTDSSNKNIFDNILEIKDYDIINL
ncbi:MAG: MBL fold metallo-hydrolase [Bacilli bacterium]|nr:MBL fold metallo-hydrolase [Bacilli bacterium]